MAQTQGQSKYWCFTLNNPTETEIQSVEAWPHLVDVTWMTYGRETGESGTPHLQGYIIFTVVKRFRTVKSYLGINRLHLERRLGSHEQARDYCWKEDQEPFTAGEEPISRQGTRTDLEAVIDAIRNGATRRQIANDYPLTYIRNFRGIDAWMQTIRLDRNPSLLFGPWRWNIEPQVGQSNIFWGLPGLGKTEYAKYLFPKNCFITHIDDLRSFSVDDHETIIFDDMSFTHLPREAQIHLVDSDNPRSIHVRYGTVRIPQGVTKIFTTNICDGAIFTHDGAINRRLNIFHLN